jgi:UDP-glucose 4-epimerase
MSRRILVTGGAGFIGTAVRKVVERNGDTFVSFDHPHDVRTVSTVRTVVAGCDGVIHLAGILGTEETLRQEQLLLDVNVGGALNIATAAEAARIPMVQIGTGHRGQPNVYAITKACAEDLILARAEWGGLQANVVRAYHAYGPGQKAPPPYGKATVRKIMPSFICAALCGDPITINGTGTQFVDLVHVDDVAAALVSGLDAPYGRTVEAGTGKAVTVVSAARDVVAACDSSSELRHVPMRAGEPKWSAVVAPPDEAVCPTLWPHLDETIAYYRTVVA